LSINRENKEKERAEDQDRARKEDLDDWIRRKKDKMREKIRSRKLENQFEAKRAIEDEEDEMVIKRDFIGKKLVKKMPFKQKDKSISREVAT
jgi:hypothetical protein